MEKDQSADPLVAQIRSAATCVDAPTRLYTAMQENSVELYRDLLPDDPSVRTGALAELSPDELREYLVPLLHDILLG